MLIMITAIFMILMLVKYNPQPFCLAHKFCFVWGDTETLRKTVTAQRGNLQRKVAGSIPDGVTGFFHWHNPSGRTLALGVKAAGS
jgi:hypothetical protein